MTDARAIPDAVLWSEGMLLLPQHFQQADQRAQALSAYLTLSAAPYAWGVRRLNFDRVALTTGRFVVTELEAIMPDGLLVLYPGDGEAPPLELDLTTVPPPSANGRVAVHLTVAVQSILAQRSGALQRFRSIEGPKVADENTGDNGATIPRLVPLLGLHATDDPLRAPPSRYASLPLVILEPGATGFAAVAFEPPRLRVERDGMLHALASGIAADLRSKAKQWDAQLRGARLHGHPEKEGDSLDTLRALLRGLPRLEAFLLSQVAHPFEIYLALCDIAGDLAVTGNRAGLPMFPAYAHANPLAAYQAVQVFLRGALEELRTPHRSISFDHPASGRFELRLDHMAGDRTLVIGARLNPEQNAAAISEWFAGALIGAESRTPAMRLNRVNGAARVAIDGAQELDLVPPPNMLLFRVTVDPAFIAAGEILQVSLPPDDGLEEPAELVLFMPAATTPDMTGAG
jgi:type VI secretion system protein ImpJ